MTLEQTIKEEHITKAVEIIRKINKKEIKEELDKLHLFQNLHNYSKYPKLICALIDKQLIDDDIYIYDDIRFCIFGQTINYLSQYADLSKITLDDFKDLFKNLEDIDEVIKGMNLMKYALNIYAPLPVIAMLVDAGCDVSFKTENDDTYLHYIAANIHSPNLLSTKDKIKKISEYIKYFTIHGLDINVKNFSENTPLLLLVNNMNSSCPVEIVQLFLDSGADIYAQDPNGYSALDYALLNESIELCTFFIDNGTIFDHEKMDNNQQSIAYKIFQPEEYNYPKHKEPLFKLLLDSGLDPYQLHQTNRKGQYETILDCILNKQHEYLQLFLDYLEDLNLNLPDEDGNTLLHKVCKKDILYDKQKAKEQYIKARALIKAGADVHLQNNEGKTAKELASTDSLKFKIVELLLKSESK